ncbi:MAG: PIG-L family deacetylase [Acidimicrobiales bacterium]|nr:PIG-L family deacetylase [Acidimicrobiales bacterium]
MATLVCFHAHPDDESIATGGTMAKAAAAGHRVVLVVATRGEHGEVADGFLDDGEPLGERRVQETLRSAELLGVQRVEFLGYTDSGMMGVLENDLPGCFWRADVDEAAGRLAAILADERADVLTVYDGHGGYGHPDHIQVHRVGLRAAELAGTARVYEATMNRDEMRRLQAAAREAGLDVPDQAADPDDDPIDPDSFGLPEAELTTAVDVRAYLDVKRASMRAHASQISEDSFFLQMPDEVFARAFGTEWYRRRDRPGGIVEDDLFGAGRAPWPG